MSEPDTVVRARTQLEQLRPILADADTHARLGGEIDALGAQWDALPAFVAGRQAALLTSRIEQLDKLGHKNFAAARAPKLVADPEAQPHVLHSVERVMAAVRRPAVL